MANIATCDEIYAGQETCWYTLCLAAYLERLEGKEAYEDFQEHRSNDFEYYALVASLAA